MTAGQTAAYLQGNAGMAYGGPMYNMLPHGTAAQMGNMAYLNMAMVLVYLSRPVSLVYLSRPVSMSRPVSLVYLSRPVSMSRPVSLVYVCRARACSLSIYLSLSLPAFARQCHSSPLPDLTCRCVANLSDAGQHGSLR